MFEYTNIKLLTTGNLLFLLGAILVALGLSYFVYKRTIPPISAKLRYFLMMLRALAILMVILLLFEPILSITRSEKEKPVVAVLIDTSASMALQDQKYNRQDIVKQILNARIFKQPPEDLQFEFYPFSYKLFDPITQLDSLQFNGDGTDLKKALETLKEKMSERYFVAVVMITDGADNLGENPARNIENYGVPVYTIGVGDPSEQKDVLISNYLTNEIIYTDEKTPVDVFIKSFGFKGEKITVSLTHGKKVLDVVTTTLPGKSLEQKVRLHFTPQQPGLFKYEIKLSRLENELTYVNNQKTFYVKVLKSKLKVALFSGAPGYDFLFLKRALKQDKNIHLTAFIEKKHGAFYSQKAIPGPAKLKEFDCFILLDFPRKSSKKEILEKLRKVLAQGKPLLLFLGRNVDYNKLWTLKEFLPFSTRPQPGQERLVYLTILPQGIYHPILQLSENEFENRSKWEELPPIFVNLKKLYLKKSAQSLAAIDFQRSQIVRRQNIPLIIIEKIGKRKTVVVTAYGLWRWDLLMWGAGKSNESYLRFLQNTIRWLVTEEDSKLVKITSNKEIYRSGEEIIFTGQVYSENYRPVDGAEVVVQIKQKDEIQELLLENIGEGRYEGTLQVLEGGDYEFTGTAHLQGRVLGRDRGKFTVEYFNLEFQNTRMNEELLKKIASLSGGKFLSPDSVQTLGSHLKFPEKYIELHAEFELWKKAPFLLLTLALLSMEWFIRKRKGML
ncbi:MAG: VWA domain-containing protein [Calditrichaeota bacterium]|nr:MAG: VWA domain-containing protein [Calditrichota bacterium]